jgi:hypothetical protein
MSIWSSIGDPALAVDNDGPDVNYRGEGKPNVIVDVARTGHHPLIRLNLWRNDGAMDDLADVLLDVDAIRILITNLEAALNQEEGAGS